MILNCSNSYFADPKYKIFLTGSGGFIGRHLYRFLTGMGASVETNLEKYESEKYSVVIHLAAVTSISQDFNPHLFEANIVLTNRIFQKKDARIIYASSCSAAHLTNPYAYTKRYSEYLGEKHGGSIGLRFFNVYGPENNKGIVHYLIGKNDGEELLLRGPYLVRDYIHVEDVLASIIYFMLASDSSSKVIDIGSGVGTKTIELVDLYQKISGKKFNIKQVPAGDNEPLSMVSNNIVSSISLEQGLIKMVNNE